MKRKLVMMSLASLVSATTAMAGLPTVVYDNIGGDDDALGFSTNILNQEWAYDDLHVANGGLLSGFSFAFGTEAFQGFARGDCEIALYLDDGAASPGSLDVSDDTLLASESFADLFASAGAFGAVIFERQDVDYHTPSVVIPNGATIWAGMKYTRLFGGNLHGVHFAPVSIGSSDHFTYDANNVTFDLDPFYPDNPNAGLGWELSVIVPEPASMTLLAIGALALLRRRS